MAISASCNFALSSGGSTSRGRVERDHHSDHGHDSATMNTINTARLARIPFSVPDRPLITPKFIGIFKNSENVESSIFCAK